MAEGMTCAKCGAEFPPGVCAWCHAADQLEAEAEPYGPMPRFLSAEMHYAALTGLEMYRHEGFRRMMARVLSRVPYPDFSFLLVRTVVVLAEPNLAEYLSPVFVLGKSVLLLGGGVLGLPEGKQVEIVLPLLASCVLRVRHPREPSRESRLMSELVDPRTGHVNPELLAEEAELDRGADQDLAVEARLGGRRARDLADRWLKEWEEFTGAGGGPAAL